MAPEGSKGTRSVRVAAAELRKALALPETERASRVREAKELLLSAADEQSAESARSREQYFTAASSAEQAQVPTADALAGILDEAQTGQTLIAAGHAVNESGAGANPEVLDRAIVALESRPDFAKMMELHFSAEPAHSPDLPSATETLKSRADQSLKELVSEARSAGSKVLDKLLQVDSTKALDAVAKLGGPFAKLPEVGTLIKKGIEKLQSAIDALMRLLDNESLKQVRDKITALWAHVSDGTMLDSLLAWAFEQQGIQAALQKVMGAQSLIVGKVDEASDLLPPLTEAYKNKMSWATALAGVTAAGSGLLLFGGVIAAGPLAAFTAGAYLLVLAAIVIIGRDYAGRKGMFHEGNGILGVIESIAQ